MMLRRAVLWLTVFALIAAQALGLMHGVTHSLHGVTHSPHGATHSPHGATHSPHGAAHSPHGATPAHPAWQALGTQANAGASGPGWAVRPFAGHDDDSTCRLFDQLGHGDAAPAVPAAALPMVPAAFLLQFFEGEVLARWVALFDARGPPSVR